MMATPADLEDFALGFSLSEGILQGPRELFGVELTPQAQGIEIRMDVAAERFGALKERRRNLTGRTGCGLCGTESLQHAVRHPAPVGGDLRVTALVVQSAVAELRRMQELHEATGATHAAGWADRNGKVLLVREDVGRHNALDKLLGAMFRQGLSCTDGFVVLTSRASYEMVQKSATVGIALVVAVSAPTALAIQLARETDMTLVGFVRPDRHTIYANPQRISK
jgi:FdhD protein